MLSEMKEKVKLGGVFHVECYDKNGKLKWRDRAENIITNQGLNHILDVVFHGTTPVSPWYVGLVTDGGTYAAADTLASHAGWTEFTSYADNRKEFVEAAASGQSISNSGNAASFAINDTGTIQGAFLASAATGTSGTLMAEANFAQGDKAVDSGDTVNVTYTLSAADDGV